MNSEDIDVIDNKHIKRYNISSGQNLLYSKALSAAELGRKYNFQF